MNGCANGMAKMPTILRHAFGDIRFRLLSLYWLARLAPGKHIVELGVRGGDSTRAFLAACEDSHKTLFSYDIEDSQQVVKEKTRMLGLPWFEASWLFFQSDSVKAGTQWSRTTVGQVGMVFVDTDHTYKTTRAEIAAWTPNVMEGGCLVFHDYWLTKDGPDDNRDGVKPAVDEWANAHPDSWSLESHDATSEDTGLAILWKEKKE